MLDFNKLNIINVVINKIINIVILTHRYLLYLKI